MALVLVDTLGVSSAFSILGGLAFLLFPPCWRIIRNTPEDIGLTVDGVAANAFAAAREEEEVIPMNWRELVASRQMLLIIGVSFGIGLMAVGGVLSQLKPRFVDTGMSSYVAMGFMCLTALLGAVGKYAWGWVCDRTTPLFATKLLFLCNALSLACIFLPHTLFNVILLVVGYGVCMGGIWTVFPSVVALSLRQEAVPPRLYVHYPVRGCEVPRLRRCRALPQPHGQLQHGIYGDGHPVAGGFCRDVDHPGT